MADTYAARTYKVIQYKAANPRAFVTAVAADRGVAEAKIVTSTTGVSGIRLTISPAKGESGEAVDVTLEDGDWLRVGGGLEVIPAATFATAWSIKV